MTTCLAVDYGTTNTVAMLRTDTSTERIKFGNDWRLPSAVFWDDAKPLVGVPALHSARQDESRFVRCPKRQMGYPSLPIAGSHVPVEHIVAALLREVRSEVVRQVGRHPDRVVFTWPVQWATSRRAAFERAVIASGFTGGQYVEEPVAAAIRVGLLDDVPVGRPLAVLDFGGGTLDIAVLVRETTGFHVVACDGIEQLGGEDIDDLLFARALDALPDRTEAGRLRHPQDWRWRRQHELLRTSCRLAKEQLSEAPTGMIAYPRHDRPDLAVTRRQFDDLVEGLLSQAVNLLRRTLQQAGLHPSTVPVYLVGGSSRIPSLAARIRGELGAAVHTRGDPQFVVSEGAALWAAGVPGAKGSNLTQLLGPQALRDYRARLGDLAQRAQVLANGVMSDPRLAEQAQELRQHATRAAQDTSQAVVGMSRRARELAAANVPSGGVPALVWVGLALVVLLVVVVALGSM